MPDLSKISSGFHEYYIHFRQFDYKDGKQIMNKVCKFIVSGYAQPLPGNFLYQSRDAPVGRLYYVKLCRDLAILASGLYKSFVII